jgi:hypothetical protein
MRYNGVYVIIFDKDHRIIWDKGLASNETDHNNDKDRYTCDIIM